MPSASTARSASNTSPAPGRRIGPRFFGYVLVAAAIMALLVWGIIHVARKKAAAITGSAYGKALTEHNTKALVSLDCAAKVTYPLPLSDIDSATVGKMQRTAAGFTTIIVVTSKTRHHWESPATLRRQHGTWCVAPAW